MKANGFAYETVRLWGGARWLESFCGAKVGSAACELAVGWSRLGRIIPL